MAVNLVPLHNPAASMPTLTATCFVELVVSSKVVKLRKPREVHDIKGMCVYTGNTFAAPVR